MKVRCVDPGCWVGFITKGREYDVLGEDEKYYEVTREDNGEPGKYDKSRFVPVPSVDTLSLQLSSEEVDALLWFLSTATVTVGVVGAFRPAKNLPVLNALQEWLSTKRS